MLLYSQTCFIADISTCHVRAHAGARTHAANYVSGFEALMPCRLWPKAPSVQGELQAAHTARTV